MKTLIVKEFSEISGPASIDFFLHNLCVKPYVPREPRRDWRVIVGSMNMGYISDTARDRTHNLFRLKREPIPLYHSIVSTSIAKQDLVHNCALSVKKTLNHLQALTGDDIGRESSC